MNNLPLRIYTAGVVLFYLSLTVWPNGRSSGIAEIHSGSSPSTDARFSFPETDHMPDLMAEITSH